MKMVYYLAAVFLIFGSMFSVLTVSTVGSSSQVFHPGTTGTITLRIANNKICSGATSAYIIDSNSYTVQSVQLSIYDTNYIHVYNPGTIGDIEPCGSIDVDVPLNIDDNAPTGIYSIPITLHAYYVNDGTKHWITRYTTATIRVSKLSDLSISALGIINDSCLLEVNIKNNGTRLSNVQIYLNGTCYLKNISSYYIGDLSSSKHLKLPVDCSNAKDGIDTLNVVLTYLDKLNNMNTLVLPTPVYVHRNKVNVDISTKDMLLSGTSKMITFDINPNANIKNLILNFNNSGVITTTNPKINVGDLYKSNQKNISVTIYTDLNPGWHYLSIYGSWIENNQVKTKTFEIPIYVSIQDGINAYVGENTFSSKTGEYTLSVIVSNLEESDVYDVEAYLNPEQNKDLYLIGATDKYIGKLTNDDFTMVQFKYKPNTAKKEIPIHLTLKFKDTGGQWHTKEIVKTMALPEKTSSVKSDGTYLLWGIVIIIILAVLWKYGYKHK